MGGGGGGGGGEWDRLLELYPTLLILQFIWNTEKVSSGYHILILSLDAQKLECEECRAKKLPISKCKSESFSGGDETACSLQIPCEMERGLDYCARITRKRETSENEAIVFGFGAIVQQKENGVTAHQLYG